MIWSILSKYPEKNKKSTHNNIHPPNPTSNLLRVAGPKESAAPTRVPCRGLQGAAAAAAAANPKTHWCAITATLS